MQSSNTLNLNDESDDDSSGTVADVPSEITIPSNISSSSEETTVESEETSSSVDDNSIDSTLTQTEGYTSAVNFDAEEETSSVLVSSSSTSSDDNDATKSAISSGKCMS